MNDERALAVHRHGVVDGGEVFVKRGEVAKANVDVLGAAHLAHRVHAELRDAHVHGSYAHARGDDRTDGGSAPHVVANDEILRGDVFHLGALAKEVRRHRRRRVALIGVVFDHHALVHLRLVVILVFVHVVGVERVRHVRADEERVAHRAFD